MPRRRVDMPGTRRCVRGAVILGLLALLSGCAAAPPEWSPIPPGEARFNAAEILAGRQLVEAQRSLAANQRIAIERFRFRDGMVEVGQTFAGSKLTTQGLQQSGDREAVRNWALTTHARAESIVATEPVSHESFRGAGWLVTYSLRDSQVHCTAGRSYLTMSGREDDFGLTYDTTLLAVFCHGAGVAPAEVRELFRRIRRRSG